MNPLKNRDAIMRAVIELAADKMIAKSLSAFARGYHLEKLQHDQQKCNGIVLTCWEGVRVEDIFFRQ